MKRTKKITIKKKPFKKWKPKTAWSIVGDKDIWKMPLKELIEVVDALFPTTEESYNTCYNYSINRMPYGWVFTITNSWHKWSDKNLEHRFGAYNEIEFCLSAFLDYVIKHKIEPHKLYEK